MSASDSAQAELAQSIIDHARALSDRGLGVGTSGNISARHGNGFLITPSGMPYPMLAPSDIVQVKWRSNTEVPIWSMPTHFEVTLTVLSPTVIVSVSVHEAP